MLKKLCSCMLVVVMSVSLCMRTEAFVNTSDDIFYSNDLGLTLTQEEYDYIIKYISEEELALYTESEMDYILQDADKNVCEPKITYVKTTYEVVDGEKNIVNEQYISEEELMSTINGIDVPLTEISTFSLAERVSTLETSMKSIELRMVSVSASAKKVTMTCTWLSLPKCRSFDVIAFRGGNDTIILKGGEESNVIGYQYYDSNKITYTSSHKNIKEKEVGVGLSVNLVDNVSQHLSVQFSAIFGTGATNLLVYGTYQHAIENVTLTQSKSYSFQYGGLGKVLDFYWGIEEKYDKTPGLMVSGSINDN